ncbi:hypothetical protein G9C85_08235 [Halorubellus sp. JP-L1]|uniref:hypothetical protein n=1 Tax=Halorubellus sp. JP-L1 TaxID=2715753 RepID=UPI001409C176|nr:hypothetical protein [Halorubellus sp. JP-L1]NHN41623.1 hypothetical protein [Halorubellus sp. JP-L1]
MGAEDRNDDESAGDADDLTDAEASALHEVELGIEHLHRAHGHLVAFHHATGRGMDHLADAETRLRETGHDALADAIRDEFLPRGVAESGHPDDPGRWSYDLLETYEESFLRDIVAFGADATDEIAGGRRHVKERRQEREWKDRAERD